MKLPTFGVVVLISLMSISCEKIIEIDIPESERKIVVNGLLNPDSVVKINLSRSLSILENNEFVYLENAQVRLSENGTDLGLLSNTGSGFYVLSGYYPNPGSEYYLQVEYPGLQTVTALAELKDPVDFSEIDTTSTTDEWGGGELRISFDFDDPAEENFYSISVTATHKVFDYFTFSYLDSLVTYPVYFSFIEEGEGIQNRLVQEGATTYFGSKAFFSDALFNGKKMDVDISISKYSFFDADTVSLDVSLEHISKPYYLYAVSSGNYDRSSGNPFAEPVSVYTNVENGLGIFSGYSFFRKNISIILERKW